MASLNKVQLIGNLGADPELRFTPNGKATTTFSVATGFSYQGSDGQPVQGTDWHRVEVWGKQAEACCQFLKKGRQVYVEGRIKTDVSGEGENRKYYTKVVASQVIFLGNGRNGSAPEANVEPAAEEQIPF
jgi:single-strand DNA-binding protein